MPTPNRANGRFDIGVARDPNADIDVNIDNNGGLTDIGVPVAPTTGFHLRDRQSMPAHKTRKDKDGPTPFNPRTGGTGYYQR